MPISHGEGGGGTICRLVPLCALIAQTEGLRFSATHPTASCSYVVCISATIVLVKGLQGICTNFQCRYYTAKVEEERFAGSYRLVR